jgi:hypothetical protein
MICLGTILLRSGKLGIIYVLPFLTLQSYTTYLSNKQRVALSHHNEWTLSIYSGRKLGKMI